MKFGWKRSDNNTHCAEFKPGNNLIKLAANNISNSHIIKEYTPIDNQKKLGSCVANAATSMLEILKGLENPNAVVQLSRLFLYWNARLFTKDTDKDEGTFIHFAMESLKTTGICSESVWEYDVDKVFLQPPITAYKQGDDNTLSDFYQIISEGEQKLKDIEIAIRANHPVVFGTLVNENFRNYFGNDDNSVFNPPKNSLGGHAMLIVGIRYNQQGKREFLIRNSWGDTWGLFSNPGHAWLSDEYIMWEETQDVFVGTRMPNLLV